MSTSPLCSLPFDLVYIVLSFSDWRDIISIGQTSRRYHHIAHSFPVWMKAAQRLMRTYRIPRKTYNLEGLGVQELRQFVARPEYIRSSCRLRDEELELSNEITCKLPDSLWIHAATMVPGGRWLITGHTLGRLYVWDLDAPMEENGRFAAVHAAQLANCTGYLGVLLIQQTQDCNGVVVLTESLDQDSPKGYNLGVIQLTLDGPEANTAPICKTWGAFTGNDTIALEGQYVAAEHQGTTRVWDWKRNLYSAYNWDLSLHPHDHDEESERIDITIRPPYVYLIHSRLRIFAAFRIPVMQELDIFVEQSHHSAFAGNHPEVDFIRPELVIDLTVPFSIYHALESARPEETRLTYEEFRLTNLAGVQFINPWNLQEGTSSENTIPFFVTVSSSDETRGCLMRYDVCQCGDGSYVNRPILKQIIETESPQLEIVSPTIAVDDFSTIWGTEGGLLYVVDLSRGLSGSVSGDEIPHLTPKPQHHHLRTRPYPSSTFIVRGDLAHNMRHRVGFDMLSGRMFKALRGTITISDYVIRTQATSIPRNSLPALHLEKQ